MNNFNLFTQLSLMLPLIFGIGLPGLKFGSDILGGIFGGRLKRQKEERERRDRIQKQINDFLTEQRTEERLRSRTALDATQLDPLFQAKAGFRGDIARDLGGLDVSAGRPFRTTSTALDPGAQDVARASFAKTAKAAGPLGAETKERNLADIMARLNALLRK